jgi:hypothetical protein
MSTGGIYTLIANSGQQDQLLLATSLLNKRLKEIHRLRCKNPSIKDPTPTLVDIEKTHVMFMNAHFKPFVAIGYEYQMTGVNEGMATFGKQITFSLPQFGDFFADMAVHLRLTGLTVGQTSQQVRYCDFLGHKLFSRVAFEINGNEIDYYDSDLYNFHYNFFIHGSGKEHSWLRCVGQEVPEFASLTQQPLVDEYREQKWILSGPQTPKQTHANVDLWIPLMFWFNRDFRLMIPSVSIPYGQRYIKVTLATAADICGGIPTSDFTTPSIPICELWTNNIFVNPEIHNIFIKRIGFQMIRVHRYTRLPIISNINEIRLDQLKWPVETMYIGMKPNVNIPTMDDWWRFGNVTTTTIPYPVAIANPTAPPDYLITVGFANWKHQTKVLDSFSLQTRGIILYPNLQSEFFNHYIPYNYGNIICAPIDPHVYMVTFNFYPGIYQPSGHYNMSNSREFFFVYQSSVISEEAPTTLVIYAVCINFIILAEGYLILRFNT